MTTPAAPRARLPGPDVARAVALAGVVVMNYHGYLNGADAAAGPGATFAQHLFDPYEGVLSTRFAATFVTVAGVGVSLLTARSRASGDPAAVRDDRWRLARRGVLLFTVGLVLDWIWPGTILFFYGAMFVVAAVICTWSTRWVVATGAAAAAAGAGLAWWGAVRRRDGEPLDWLLRPRTLDTRSPRGLLFDTFVNGTHPLLPWLAFLCAGIVVGRTLPHLPVRRLVALGAALLAGSYVVAHVGRSGTDGNDPADLVRRAVLSTRPYDRGLLYVIGAIGSSLVAVAVCWVVAERFARSVAVEALVAAGRLTLTIYVLHVLAFRWVVDQRGWVRPTGLDTALVLALGVWSVAVAGALVWSRTVGGLGPCERVERRFRG